jgi:FlaA1/EpsC-like NDP-sugar epimerase/lipopolysaccharide/colanic/teichoic acid biosynthesis glycosyltransferase
MHLAKRLIDILLSLLGLIILIPILPVIAVMIKLDSKGPVFYLVDRVGKNMKIFKMYKFRTMLETPIDVGESVSPQFDPRVTAFGRFLRRTKMNELPQFINILRGEMTFVGPRPEAPDLAGLYPEEARRLFSVKPGLVGPSTILGRNEEESFPTGVDVKKYYIETILPNKVKLDLEYIDNPSFFKDFMYILAGLKVTLVGAFNKRHIQDNRSQIYLLLADLLLIVSSFNLVICDYIKNLPEGINLVQLFMILGVVIVARLSCNIYFGMYSSLIRYISYHEILGVLKAVTCGSIFIVLVAYIFGLDYYPYKVAVIDWAYLMLLHSALRLGLKFYWERRRRKTEGKDKRRVLIYGANDAGYVVYRALAQNGYSPFEVIGFIDEAPDKYGKILNGLKVLGNRYHVKALARLYRVEEMVVPKQNVEPSRLTEIAKICQESDLKVRIFPSSVSDFVSRNSRASFPRDLEPSDILPLQQIHSNHSAVREVVMDKTVLINGSGGALGAELCAKILQLGCRRLIIVDGFEMYLNETVASLSKDFSNGSIVPVLNDISRVGVLNEVFEAYRPDFVIHAGMRKYVPFLPVDLGDIGRTNYLRTFDLATVAAKFECELFLMVSNMMAGKGGNLIADSLRVAEVSLEHFFTDTNTRLIITRICDIAENRGGIVSVMEDQIRMGEMVILPSIDAQTMLISKYSAAEFILQALVEGKKGSSDKKNIFVCDGGSPVPLIEIARKLANFYGLKLGTDVPVRYTEQSEEPALIYPLKISSPESTYHIHDMIERDSGRPETQQLTKIFKDFVIANNKQLSVEDWRIITATLLNLCRPVSRTDRS